MSYQTHHKFTSSQKHYDESYTDESYPDESYPDESYTDESYPDDYESYTDKSYSTMVDHVTCGAVEREIYHQCRKT